MSNTAKTQYPIHEIINQRWSPRAFADKPISQQDLLSILEAARWAPSARNEQPWVYIVATKDHPDEYDQLLGILNESNAVWVKNAPVIVLAVAKMFFDYKHRQNRHAHHDLGLSIAMLLLQTVALGLHGHPMAGFDRRAARQTYNIPEDFEPMTMIALGYLDEAAKGTENWQARMTQHKQRKSLGEFVYFGDWEQPHPWLEG